MCYHRFIPSHKHRNGSSDTIEYDFRRLDIFLDHLVDIGLIPVIELMGNPSGQMQPRSSHLAAAWTALVEQMLTRYIGKCLTGNSVI